MCGLIWLKNLMGQRFQRTHLQIKVPLNSCISEYGEHSELASSQNLPLATSSDAADIQYQTSSESLAGQDLYLARISHES